MNTIQCNKCGAIYRGGDGPNWITRHWDTRHGETPKAKVLA